MRYLLLLVNVSSHQRWIDSQLALSSQCAEEDFTSDAAGADSMSREQFMDAIYELCDLWTKSLEVSEYVAFLRRLFREVAELAPDGALYFWRQESTVVYGGWDDALVSLGAPRRQVGEGERVELSGANQLVSPYLQSGAPPLDANMAITKDKNSGRRSSHQSRSDRSPGREARRGGGRGNDRGMGRDGEHGGGKPARQKFSGDGGTHWQYSTHGGWDQEHEPMDWSARDMKPVANASFAIRRAKGSKKARSGDSRILDDDNAHGGGGSDKVRSGDGRVLDDDNAHSGRGSDKARSGGSRLLDDGKAYGGRSKGMGGHHSARPSATSRSTAPKSGISETFPPIDLTRRQQEEQSQSTPATAREHGPVRRRLISPEEDEVHEVWTGQGDMLRAELSKMLSESVPARMAARIPLRKLVRVVDTFGAYNAVSVSKQRWKRGAIKVETGQSPASCTHDSGGSTAPLTTGLPRDDAAMQGQRRNTQDQLAGGQGRPSENALNTPRPPATDSPRSKYASARSSYVVRPSRHTDLPPIKRFRRPRIDYSTSPRVYGGGAPLAPAQPFQRPKLDRGRAPRVYIGGAQVKRG